MNWNTIRNNTSFIHEVNEFFRTIERGDVLRYHQEIVVNYFVRYSIRGALLFHKMGMGKSLLAAAIANHLMQTMDAIFISAKTLHINFDETMRKFTELTGTEFNGKITYVSLNASNMMTQVNRATLTPIEQLMSGREKMRGSLDNKVIIVDEAHNFFNSITNGSSNATRLYHAIMKSDCRVIFLSGSPITNDPFEIGLCFNMLTGTTLFPENYVDFTNYFTKQTTATDGSTLREIKNPGKFSNRINGLVSYYDAGATTSNAAVDFPTELPLKVVNCTMSKFQYNLYFQARKYEIEQQLKKHRVREEPLQKLRASNASYRVMSRQLSNFAYPEDATEHRRNEHGRLIDEHYFDRLDPLNVYKNIEIYSPKIATIVNTALHQPGIGIIYSQFLKYGLNIIAMYLDQLTAAGDFDGKYAMITGEIEKEEVAKLVHEINSPQNNNAQIYKLVLISGTASEGVDFKNIRHIHIMEPYWHWSRILQVIGRGVRLGSHNTLDVKDRTVQPFIYISQHGIKDNTEQTTDEYLMAKSLKNQHLINSFYLIMRMSAFDCPMHYRECKTCQPTNKQLFVDDILIDLTSTDPCRDQRTTQARIFEYEGDIYAEYEEDGEIFYARLNDNGKYEKVTEEIRLLLLSIVKNYRVEK